jgi:hypothetical protein
MSEVRPYSPQQERIGNAVITVMSRLQAGTYRLSGGGRRAVPARGAGRAPAGPARSVPGPVDHPGGGRVPFTGSRPCGAAFMCAPTADRDDVRAGQPRDNRPPKPAAVGEVARPT